LVKLFHWKGTDYTLNWIPLGGFVRMKGETDPSVPGGFMTAKPMVRIAILLAGPAANILVAIVLFAIAFSQIGVPDTSKVLVMEVASSSPADEAGLLPGDQIISINDVDASSTIIVQETIRESLEQDTLIVVSRDGDMREVNLVPRANPPEGQGAIGITMSHRASRFLCGKPSLWEPEPLEKEPMRC
jgi:regulator of sigma E protease